MCSLGTRGAGVTSQDVRMFGGNQPMNSERDEPMHGLIKTLREQLATKDEQMCELLRIQGELLKTLGQQLAAKDKQLEDIRMRLQKLETGAGAQSSRGGAGFAQSSREGRRNSHSVTGSAINNDTLNALLDRLDMRMMRMPKREDIEGDIGSVEAFEWDESEEGSDDAKYKYSRYIKVRLDFDRQNRRRQRFAHVLPQYEGLDMCIGGIPHIAKPDVCIIEAGGILVTFEVKQRGGVAEQDKATCQATLKLLLACLASPESRPIAVLTDLRTYLDVGFVEGAEVRWLGCTPSTGWAIVNAVLWGVRGNEVDAGGAMGQGDRGGDDDVPPRSEGGGRDGDEGGDDKAGRLSRTGVSLQEAVRRVQSRNGVDPGLVSQLEVVLDDDTA